MKKLLLLFFFVPGVSFAQLENANWYFGDSAGIKFTSTGIIPITDAVMNSYKSSAAISDSLGNLLFYTQSQTIWNKNNDTMENGFAIKPHLILPVQDWAVSLESQGAMILPQPNHKNIYNLFSLVLGQDSALVLSKIDMNQNGGLGKVVSKNHFIYTKPLSEFMTAVKHANGRDYWIVCHEQFSSKFIKFLLTPDSLEGPYFQELGNHLDTLYYYYWGQTVFSPQGNKYLVACDQGILKLFDFDRCNGEFSNMIDLSTPPYPYFNNRALYGCAFSPDGRKIYVGDRKVIFQFDLDSVNIISSKDTVSSVPFGNYLLANLQLGIDKKIYFGTAYKTVYNSVYSTHNMNISVIDSPDNKGERCTVKIDYVSLGGKRIITGLPNIVNYSLGALKNSLCDTLFTNEESNVKNEKSIVRIFPNPTQDELAIEVLNGVALKQLVVTDALGRTVLQFTPLKPNSQLNIHSLASGVYFIKVQMQDGEMEVRKFVKE